MSLGPTAVPPNVNMAGDSESSKPVDKGKGKAVDDPKKEKPAVNGKKDDGKIIDGKRCSPGG